MPRCITRVRRFERVYCVFVFDTGILDVLPSRTDRALRSSMQACWRWTMGCANCRA